MEISCDQAVYERVTKNAVRGIWARRSKLNLVGAHINVFTGEWTQKVTQLNSLLFFKIRCKRRLHAMSLL